MRSPYTIHPSILIWTEELSFANNLDKYVLGPPREPLEKDQQLLGPRGMPPGLKSHLWSLAVIPAALCRFQVLHYYLPEYMGYLLTPS